MILDRVGHRKELPVTEIKILAETPDTVTLRRADYQALVAAAADVADLAAVRDHSTYEDRVGWQAARRNYLSRREAQRLLDGESPVRVWREKRGLSQRALAAAAQISPSYLAEIETGRKPGSKNALLAVATVLEVLLEELVHPPGISPHPGQRASARSHSPRGSSR
ncbi:MAG: helix-turn-helix domain-containing protein [Alphaproteobacteria bacterium]